MKSNASVAVASRSFSRNRVLRAELLERYRNVTFNDAGVSLRGDDLIAFLRGHERAIIALERLDAGVLSCLPNLKVVSKYGVGLDNICIDAMRKYGKRLGWRGGVNRRSVAELALGFMISLLHNVPSSSHSLRNGVWEQVLGRQLTGKTVGILGCGNVGKDLVLLLQPFQVRILVYDTVDYREFYERYNIKSVDLEFLLSQSDVVTVHLPLDETTRGIISYQRISQMKKGAVLINTARGGIVDDAAVKDALLSGKLTGIGFDVFEIEPPQDYELVSLSNALATPHIGGSAEEAVLAMGRAAIEGLEENAIP